MGRKTRGAGSRPQAAEAQASEVTLDRLLGALPQQADLVPLREALLRASSADAARAWSRASSYATFDKRVLPADALRNVVAAAARAAHARIDALYDAIAEVLDFAARGDDVSAASRLIAIGEAAEAEDSMQSAVSYYEVAAVVSETLADRRVRVLALRRLARVSLTLGQIDEATNYYRNSCEQAQASADVEGQVIGLIGLGNVLIYQGRWAEAEQQYEQALSMTGDSFARMRGQIAINLATVQRERGQLDEAAAQLGQATELWAELHANDHSVWYNNRGLLSLARGEVDSAEAIFRQALETAGSDFDRAMVLDNLAELYVRQGRLSDAEAFARSAEEVALRAGSPRALAEIYMRLGKISRLRSDLNGVTFFEKALEICRERRYPLTEANAYLEYGIFRRTLGDTEEARSYLERARQLCAGIGAVQLERVAADQLAQL